MTCNMTWVVLRDIVRQSGGSKVIIHVQHICQQRLGRRLLHIQILHLLSHHKRFLCYFLARSGHSQQPRNPLEKSCLNLPQIGLCCHGLLMFEHHLPIQAFHVCLPAYGGSSGSWWWWCSSRPPWTWYKWSRFLKVQKFLVYIFLSGINDLQLKVNIWFLECFL